MPFVVSILQSSTVGVAVLELVVVVVVVVPPPKILWPEWSEDAVTGVGAARELNKKPK